jgi:hypothetical protein
MVRTISATTQRLIQAAHNNGYASESYKASQSRYIELPGNKKMTLLLPSGEATPAGKFYYNTVLGLTDLPLLYAYESELIQDKWILGFNGKKVLVRRRDASGQWAATKAGLQYFKFARDEHSVAVGAYRLSANGSTLISIEPQVLSHESFITEYIQNPAATLQYQRLTTEAEQE